MSWWWGGGGGGGCAAAHNCIDLPPCRPFPCGRPHETGVEGASQPKTPAPEQPNTAPPPPPRTGTPWRLRALLRRMRRASQSTALRTSRKTASGARGLRTSAGDGGGRGYCTRGRLRNAPEETRGWGGPSAHPAAPSAQIRRRRIPLSHSFDVLFLGNYTDRRKAVLDKIMALGMTVELVTPLDFGHFEYTPLWDVSDRIHTAKVCCSPSSHMGCPPTPPTHPPSLPPSPPLAQLGLLALLGPLLAPLPPTLPPSPPPTLPASLLPSLRRIRIAQPE